MSDDKRRLEELLRDPDLYRSADAEAPADAMSEWRARLLIDHADRAPREPLAGRLLVAVPLILAAAVLVFLIYKVCGSWGEELRRAAAVLPTPEKSPTLAALSERLSGLPDAWRLMLYPVGGVILLLLMLPVWGRRLRAFRMEF